MTLKEKILFHQVHPAKLGTDIAAAVISLYFFWQHQLALGVVTHVVPPPLASAMVICWVNLEPYRGSRVGAYLLRYMTPLAQAARLAGDLVTVFGAWFHAPLVMGAGFLIIVAAWSYGLAHIART